MEQEKKRSKKPIIIIIAALVLVAGIGAGLFLVQSGVLDSSYKNTGEPPVPTIHAGDVMVMDMEALDTANHDTDEEGLKAYYAGAVQYAVDNGFNTILYQGKPGDEVYWRDNHLDMSPTVTANDTWLNKKFDPLKLFLEQADTAGVQVWLGVNAPLAGEDLQASLTELPQRYGVAKVVLTGVGETGDSLGDFATALRAAWQEKGYATGLAVRLPHAAAAQNYAALVSAGTVDTVISTATGYEEAMALGAAPSFVIAQPKGGKDGEALFAAATLGGYDGALLAYYSERAGSSSIASLKTYLQPASAGALPAVFEIPQTLTVNYPAEGAKIYTEGLFIMGTSDPAQPLLMDGEEVARSSENGAFGVLVTLPYGDSSFTFTQGAESHTLNVSRPEASGGGGAGGEMPSDSTVEAQPGQAVRIVSVIASALTDPNDDGTMNETFVEGAVAVVEESFETTRYFSSAGRTMKTWAYKLRSGDYVLAYNTQWVGDGSASFTGITATADEGGEWLAFGGSGSPAAYISYSSDGPTQLRLTMYDTSFNLPEGFSSQYVKSASVEESEDGAGITLVLTLNPIWGYSIEYGENTTGLYLKRVPQQSADALRPLDGVHVLLDPGHGDNDIGAAGLMGGEGPNEKDMNLALAQTIAYRLEQLGAQVTMTRTDDTFLTLDERLALQTQLKPDFFISVHHNSAELTADHNGTMGAMGFYYHPYNTPNSKALAQNIHERVVGATGRNDRGTGWGYYYVTRTTVCPSVLYEYGFVVSPVEFEDITSKQGINAAALATADAILAMVPEAGGTAPAGGTETPEGGADASVSSTGTMPEEDKEYIAPD